MMPMKHSCPRATGRMRTLAPSPIMSNSNRWSISAYIKSVVIAAVFFSSQSLAFGATPEAEDHIEFFIDFGANCVARSAKQILVKNNHPSKAIKIKLVRYFGDVRQPGRSVYVLPPVTEALALGCDKIQGRTQRWDVHSAEFE